MTPRSVASLPGSRLAPLPLSLRALLPLASVLCLLAGLSSSVRADSARATVPPAVLVDPVQVKPEPEALNQYVRPDDFVILDTSGGNSTRNITVINGGLSGTFGASTVVASTSVGGGVAFNGTSQACVSPAQQLYYWDNILSVFVAIDLTQPSYPRTLVPVPNNISLVPGSEYATAVPGMVWDYSTNTILYIDNGANTAKSTIARGIYRLNPVTGVNTFFAPFTGGTLNSIAIKQDGSAVYGFNQNGNTFGVNASVYQIAPNTGTTTPVDGGAALYGSALNQPRYVEAVGISWDIFNQKLTLFDVGDDQTSSRILRIDPVTRTRAFVSNGSAGAAATRDNGGIINAPNSGFTNTAGRILYTEEPVDLTQVFPATIAFGSSTATRVGSNQFSNSAYFSTYIPPTLPAIASPTATPGANGTTATLGATVSSSGTAINPPAVLTRGVVYSPTSLNSNPIVGGSNVTNVSATAATGAYTVSPSGLTKGTSYSYAGYVSTYCGLVYTAVGTFITPSTPTVATTTPATAITGTGATLGGNVTSDGGSSVTVRGVVYSLTSANNAPAIGGTGVTDAPNGMGTGTYSQAITGLAQGAQYSYRAYATNGVGTTYGTVGAFTTAAAPTANSQTVSVSFNMARPVTLTGSDPNTPTQTLTYSITTSPAHGTFSGTAPNLTYTPTTGYNGSDSFQFTVTNTSGLTSNTATVTLNIAAGTPTATAQTVRAYLNQPRAITLAGTDPDVPALPLTYTVATAPAHGTLSGTAPNLTYTPASGFSGADSFTFTVSNGQNTSAAATVSITVQGDPVITGFTASGAVGSVVTFTGSQFTGATGVTFFRNVAAASFTVVSDTQLTVSVPGGATTGTLRVTTPAGTTTTPTKFTVTPP